MEDIGANPALVPTASSQSSLSRPSGFDPGELLALADRCETATGPDLDAPNRRALSDDIGRAFGAAFACGHAPDYCASLDAAMTLVPDGWDWFVQSMGDVTGTPIAAIWCAKYGGVPSYRSQAATPAVALCAAALRAGAEQ